MLKYLGVQIRAVNLDSLTAPERRPKQELCLKQHSKKSVSPGNPSGRLSNKYAPSKSEQNNAAGSMLRNAEASSKEMLMLLTNA